MTAGPPAAAEYAAVTTSLPTVVPDVLAGTPELAARVARVLGHPTESVGLIERRARELLPEFTTIVWEADPETFQFTHVSRSAADVLGHPCERWLTEPTFWADVVLHPEDRDAAMAFCAVATGLCKDHDFRYRAVAADGRTVMLLDVVQVVRGPRGVAERLRGVMFQVS